MGQPATVSAIVTSTCAPVDIDPRTMSSSTTLRRISGSITPTSASRISSWAITAVNLEVAVHQRPQCLCPLGVAGGDGPRTAVEVEAEHIAVNGRKVAPASRTISAAAARSTERDGFRVATPSTRPSAS